MITLSPALKFSPQMRKRDCAKSAFELQIQITGFNVPTGVATLVGGAVAPTVVPELDALSVVVGSSVHVAIGKGATVDDIGGFTRLVGSVFLARIPIWLENM